MKISLRILKCSAGLGAIDMLRLSPGKLHVVLKNNVKAEGSIVPRLYTLTHSDITGDLFLTISPSYYLKQISGIYTKLMRDEVLAEWGIFRGVLSLIVHCHVSGGLAFGKASWRGVRDIPRVDKKFRTYGPEDQKKEYHKRPHIEAVYSFLRTQYNLGINKVRGVTNVACYALCSLLWLALHREVAETLGRPDKAVSPTYFNT